MASRHVVGRHGTRDDRHAHSTNHDSRRRQLKSWGTCGTVAFVLESRHWVSVMTPSTGSVLKHGVRASPPVFSTPDN